MSTDDRYIAIKIAREIHKKVGRSEDESDLGLDAGLMDLEPKETNFGTWHAPMPAGPDPFAPRGGK